MRGQRDPLDPSRVADEPSNGELARMIRALSDRIAEDRDQAEEFRAELKGQISGFQSALTGLQQRVAVDEATAAAKFDAIKEEKKTHDQYHQAREKEEKDRRERTSTTATIVVGILTAAVAIVGLIVGLVVH